MCDRYDDRDLPVCPCGGDIILVDNDKVDTEDLMIWGECTECGRTGEKFDTIDDALEECYTWK